MEQGSLATASTTTLPCSSYIYSSLLRTTPAPSSIIPMAVLEPGIFDPSASLFPGMIGNPAENSGYRQFDGLAKLLTRLALLS